MCKLSSQHWSWKELGSIEGTHALLKVRCHILFKHTFSAFHCSFEDLTIVTSTNFFLKMHRDTVIAQVKRMWQPSLLFPETKRKKKLLFDFFDNFYCWNVNPSTVLSNGFEQQFILKRNSSYFFILIYF